MRGAGECIDGYARRTAADGRETNDPVCARALSGGGFPRCLVAACPVGERARGDDGRGEG